MNDFFYYLQEGFQHIVNLQSYDYLLFILVLGIVHASQEWKKLFVIMIAFTIGHSTTLILCSLDVFRVDFALTKILIPITILAIIILNFFYHEKRDQREKDGNAIRYICALIFGSVHGIAFSHYLVLLSSDVTTSQLIGFNIGIEIGEISILIPFILISFMLVHLFRIKKRELILIISSAIASFAILLLRERLHELNFQL